MKKIIPPNTLMLVNEVTRGYHFDKEAKCLKIAYRPIWDPDRIRVIHIPENIYNNLGCVISISGYTVPNFGTDDLQDPKNLFAAFPENFKYDSEAGEFLEVDKFEINLMEKSQRFRITIYDDDYRIFMPIHSELPKSNDEFILALNKDRKKEGKEPYECEKYDGLAVYMTDTDIVHVLREIQLINIRYPNFILVSIYNLESERFKVRFAQLTENGERLIPGV
jgi:hypothetical protein